MEFLSELGLFGAKALVIVISIVIVMVVFAALVAKNKLHQHLEIRNLSEKWKESVHTLRHEVFNKKELKEWNKKEKQEDKALKEHTKPNQFVLSFNGDIKASAVDQLREEITLVLNTARPQKDEVTLLLESPGGMVHGYGLAAAQLMRVKKSQIKLTVCVDKVAASGGYLMACVADKIVAAPFAILGSIGVLAQVPNFNKFLKKHDIDYEEITAGEYKRTISLLGEITEKGREKFTEDIQDTHTLFKNFVAEHRPQLDIQKVATGEHWFGLRAQSLALSDEIKTSDEHLMEMAKTFQLIEVKIKPKKSLSKKLSEGMSMAFSKVVESGLYKIKR